MTEIRNTVMNDTLIQAWCLEFVQPGELDLNAKLKEFAQAQAKMSFRPGIMVGLARGNNPLDSPCIFCEYAGEFYWQRETHSENCPFFNIGGIADRRAWLKESLAIKEENHDTT